MVMPREKIANVKAERDHYKKLVEERFGPRLRELNFRNGEFRADLCGEMVEAMALAFISHFKDGGAENFVEMSIYDRGEPFQRYTLTVQKVGALSPADKLRNAEARVTECEGALKAYEQWEADVILENECWTGQNVRLTDELWDRMIEIQAMRNTALGRFSSATQVAEAA